MAQNYVLRFLENSTRKQLCVILSILISKNMLKRKKNHYLDKLMK